MKDSESPDKQFADATPNTPNRLRVRSGNHMSIAARALILTWIMIGLLIAGGIGFYFGRKTAPKVQNQSSSTQQQPGAQQQSGGQQQQPSGQQLPQGTNQSPAPSGTDQTGPPKPADKPQ